MKCRTSNEFRVSIVIKSTKVMNWIQMENTLRNGFQNWKMFQPNIFTCHGRWMIKCNNRPKSSLANTIHLQSKSVTSWRMKMSSQTSKDYSMKRKTIWRRRIKYNEIYINIMNTHSSILLSDHHIMMNSGVYIQLYHDQKYTILVWSRVVCIGQVGHLNLLCY